MKLKLTLISLIVLSFFLFSCAGTYNRISPEGLAYQGQASTQTELLGFSYQYNVLEVADNKKYNKKEQKSSFHLVAVKLTNRSNRTLDAGEDVQFYSGNMPIAPVPVNEVISELKQKPASHLLYLLLTPLMISADGVGTIPAGLAIGPGLAAGNGLTARNANKKLREELEKYQLQGKEIRPGESVVGLIAIPKNNYSLLSAGLKNQFMGR